MRIAIHYISTTEGEDEVDDQPALINGVRVQICLSLFNIQSKVDCR